MLFPANLVRLDNFQILDSSKPRGILIKIHVTLYLLFWIFCYLVFLTFPCKHGKFKHDKKLSKISRPDVNLLTAFKEPTDSLMHFLWIFCNRDVFMFSKLVAHQGQWKPTSGGPYQKTKLINNIKHLAFLENFISLFKWVLELRWLDSDQ